MAKVIMAKVIMANVIMASVMMASVIMANVTYGKSVNAKETKPLYSKSQINIWMIPLLLKVVFI